MSPEPHPPGAPNEQQGPVRRVTRRSSDSDSAGADATSRGPCPRETACSLPGPAQLPGRSERPRARSSRARQDAAQVGGCPEAPNTGHGAGEGPGRRGGVLAGTS